MHFDLTDRGQPIRRARGIIAAASAAFLSAACSAGPMLGGIGQIASLGDPKPSATEAAGPGELDKAIEYWGGEFKKRPHSLTAALSYARNLKAAGRKKESFQVIQSASLLHGDSRELASEYGRLALEFGQIGVAEKVLAAADDPAKPDWRVISARGTVLAKQGQYGAAVPFYERALQLSPNEPSVMNNLALTHVANGEPVKAEQILRQAASSSDDPKVKQNLALVLGLQGKHSEAQNQASEVLTPTAATADAAYLRRLVKAPGAQPEPTPAIATASAGSAGQPVQPSEPTLSADSIIAMAQSQARQQSGAQAQTGSASRQPNLRSTRGTNEVATGTSDWGQALANNN